MPIINNLSYLKIGMGLVSIGATKDQRDVGHGFYQDGSERVPRRAPLGREETMNLVKATIILTCIFIGQSALSMDMIRLQVGEVNPNIPVEKVETYYGEVLKIGDMKGFSKREPLKSVIHSRQIEMKNGNIYYPEEVEYVIESVASGRFGANQKAPHTPD